MPYKKQVFVDNETVLTAENMNHIEDGISAATEQAEENKAALVAMSPEGLASLEESIDGLNTTMEELFDGVAGISEMLDDINGEVV